MSPSLGLPPEMIEAYLSINLLLATGALVGGYWATKSGTSLRLVRLALLSCALAPLCMIFISPTHGPILSTALDDMLSDELEAQPLARLMNAERSERIAVKETLPEFSPDIKTASTLLVATAIFFGFLFYMLRLTRDGIVVSRIIRRAVPLRQYRQVRVSVSDECAVPFSVRFLSKAHIVLPAAMIADPRAVAMAVAHEAQHHRQGDCVTAYAVEILRALCFWNPFVHRWQRILTHLQEFSCDEALIGRRRFSPHEYGSCLFNVAQAAISLKESKWEFACAPGLTRNERGKPQSLLLRRIEMLSKYSSARSPQGTRPRFMFSIFAAVAVGLPVGLSFAARGTIAGEKVESTGLDQSMLDPAYDPRIQAIAASEVEAALKRFRAKSAAALVMDPASGRVLAFAEEHSGPWQESWSTRVFAPASTIKPFILASAIEAGVSSEQRTYDCRAPLVVNGHAFHNWQQGAGSALTATEAMVSSWNVCAVRMAQDTGSIVTRSVLSRFGIEPTWNDGESDALQLAHTALGNSEPVTFARLTKAFATLAHGGTVPGSAEQAVSQQTAQAVGKTMIEVIRRGTGRKASIPGITVAGKTGTSAFGAADDETQLAIFAGFAPAENPSYVALVIVEDGKNRAGEKLGGGAAAAPTFREIIRRSLSLPQK